jgi:hypothetical protein
LGRLADDAVPVGALLLAGLVAGASGRVSAAG